MGGVGGDPGWSKIDGITVRKRNFMLKNEDASAN